MNNIEKTIEPFDLKDIESKTLELILGKEFFDYKVWDPACDVGHISEVLEKYGYSVKSTDIVYRGYGYGGIDFLDDDITIWHGDIITKPPYEYEHEFIEKALDIISEGHKVVMLLKTLFLESEKTKELFMKYQPKKMYIGSPKLYLDKNGDIEKYGMITLTYTWIIWEKGYTGKTIVDWLD